MKRGELWTVAERGEYTGNPRPAVILQDDRFDETASVTVCGFTTASVDAPLMRVRIEPDAVNGLDAPSYLMVDKITTVRRTSMRERMGQLNDADILRLNRALVVFLGIAS